MEAGAQRVEMVAAHPTALAGRRPALERAAEVGPVGQLVFTAPVVTLALVLGACYPVVAA
jgi:hypothetical protein